MDHFGWLWVVSLCSWLVGASAMKGLGRKVLNDVERVSPIILDIGLWEIFLGVWAVLAVFSILAISMARLKNIRKGKATNFSVERTVKKRKANTLQTMKKGKGKEKAIHRKARKKVKAKIKRLRLCLLNPRNPSEKSGFS